MSQNIEMLEGLRRVEEICYKLGIVELGQGDGFDHASERTRSLNFFKKYQDLAPEDVKEIKRVLNKNIEKLKADIKPQEGNASQETQRQVEQAQQPAGQVPNQVEPTEETKKPEAELKANEKALDIVTKRFKPYMDRLPSVDDGPRRMGSEFPIQEDSYATAFVSQFKSCYVIRSPSVLPDGSEG